MSSSFLGTLIKVVFESEDEQGAYGDLKIGGEGEVYPG